MRLNSRITDNSALNFKEASAGLSTLSSYPQLVIIQVTNRCQLQCPMCLIQEGRDLIDLPGDVLFRVAEEVTPYAAYVALSGGEPLLYKGLSEFFDRFAKPDGPVIDFVTNAVLLNDKMMEKVVENGVVVYVSLNGATKETHESTRPETKFENIIKKIRRLSELKRRLNSQTLVGISYVMLKNNISEMPRIIDLMADVGADIIRFGYFVAGDENHRQAFQPDQDKKVLNQYFLETRIKAFDRKITAYVPKFYMVDKDGEYNSYMRKMEKEYPIIENPLMEPVTLLNSFNKRECHDPWTTTVIDMEGLVHPCCLSYPVLGDLKSQSFAEIWNGEPYRNLRHSISTKDIENMMPGCRVCPSYSSNYKASLASSESVIVEPIVNNGPRITSLVKLGAHYLKAEGVTSTSKRLSAFVKRRLKKQNI